MTDKNPRGKKPVFSDTAPCIMLTFCSHKFSDLQLWTTTGCVRCQPEVCSRLTLFQDRNIIWLIRLLFCCCFFFFFLLPCSKLDVFVQKDVLKQFFFLNISLRWRQELVEPLLQPSSRDVGQFRAQ